MFDENEFHRRIGENTDALGGYPSSLEMKYRKARREREKRKSGKYLGKNFGKDVDKEIKRKYKTFPAVRSATFYEDRVIKGSTPFYVVAANEVLRDYGLRTATPADLERILENNLLDLSGVFVETALVLRRVDRPNKYLAKKLENQLKDRHNISSYSTLMIPLSELELEKYQNSRHGLAFKLKEDATIIYASQLEHENNLKRFSKTNKSGLPIFDEKGERTLLTRESGLSRLHLSRNNLYSYFNYLDCTGAYGAGRIIVVNKL